MSDPYESDRVCMICHQTKKILTAKSGASETPAICDSDAKKLGLEFRLGTTGVWRYEQLSDKPKNPVAVAAIEKKKDRGKP